jgi:hypothetical protein
MAAPSSLKDELISRADKYCRLQGRTTTIVDQITNLYIEGPIVMAGWSPINIHHQQI